ncbi:MAG: flagellar export chaperone FliS [Candidatus Nitricoxidivorans perseverans]|uniref:Flagellar secretion chaperone FliS n=1 Tax=Candidatus Nitricoxidivorans perseverans TaxID=2975601 RepID=A0AA49FMD1_9PROT|nr:MAG: flagellar export chaperone FliS [Candidatus Nitricoxidivorans perseverans]
MFQVTAMNTRQNPAAAYAAVGLETGVPNADPHKLILMLFDGALLSIASASMHMREKHIAEKGEALSKAIDIITNGLKASLDIQAGGEFSERLAALYDYMCVRLLYANMKNDMAALNEVSHLLGEIRSAWEEIADDPAVLSENRAAA